jgi:hypothetical protein
LKEAPTEVKEKEADNGLVIEVMRCQRLGGQESSMGVTFGNEVFFVASEEPEGDGDEIKMELEYSGGGFGAKFSESMRGDGLAKDGWGFWEFGAFKKAVLKKSTARDQNGPSLVLIGGGGWGDEGFVGCVFETYDWPLVAGLDFRKGQAKQSSYVAEGGENSRRLGIRFDLKSEHEFSFPRVLVKAETLFSIR